MGTSTIDPQIKLLNKQLTKCRRVTTTFLVVVHRRAEELVSLSSGQQAPGDVKQDLLKARKIGEKELREFIDNRILSDKVGFYEPNKCLKLKTFTSLTVT